MTNGIIDSGQEIVTNGLVLHLDAAQRRSYSGTGTTWTDLSGNSNNGTLTNGPTFNSANGGIIQFDGTNDNVLIPNATSIISTTALTIAMWVKWTTVGTTTSTIQALFDNKHYTAQGLVIQDRPDLGKKLSFTINPADSNLILSTSIVGDGNWKYVVCTYGSGVSKMYINGILEGQASQSSVGPIQPNITLGIWQFNNTRALNGTIATTSVYNRALSDAEVLQNYNATKTRFQVPALLDLYPNAAAAYSLRKLRSGYTGSAVRVRRSSDNTEQDIGFTSTGDLDTTALTTFVGANNGFVTTWYDQSGNNRNATQSTTGNQPMVVSGGTVLTQNSKPILQFAAPGVVLNSPSFSLGVNRTYIMTLYNAINSNNSYKVYLGAVAGGSDNLVNGLVGKFSESNVVYSYIGSSAANASVGIGALQSSSYFLLGSYVQGSIQHQHYRNGILNAQNTSLTISPTITSQVNSILAAPNPGTNDLRTNECIIYNSYEISNRPSIEANINSYYGIYNSNIDSDAQSFITAAAITDSTQQGAVDALVKDLKNYGLWTKMKAIYPFVGGTAASHKFNLKDPRDVDGAFRLVFNGGWTHSATGALPDGSTGYANTYFIPSSGLTVDSTHMSIYSNTNNAVLSGSTDPVDMGSYNFASQSITLVNSVLTGTTRNLGAIINWTQSTRLGLVTTNKTASNITKIHKNGVVVASGSSVGTLPTLPIFIGTLNYLGNPYNIGYTNNRFAFATIGDGLTDTEAANLYTAVQKYQTTLERQV